MNNKYIDHLSKKLHASTIHLLVADYLGKRYILQQSAKNNYAFLWGQMGRNGKEIEKFFYEDFTAGEKVEDCMARAKAIGLSTNLEDIPLESWEEKEYL